MSLALARKYRPTRFADVAVQSHVAATLKGAIARGRVAHGYLLCGPRGVGKTTLARVLAMALNCERRVGAGASAAGTSASDEALARGAGASAAGTSASDETLVRGAGEPCGECASCRRIWSGAASLDVVEIDAASNRGVDDARELRERAMYAPSGDDRYKVYIVDEAHMLTREAWNALLKILEEPPPRVVFVFATTEPQKIAQSAAPVLSRLQRFDFKRIGPAEVRERLAHVLGQEGVEADVDALTMIARAADGSMRDALSLTDQVLSMGEGRITVERVRDALGLVPEDEWLALLDIIADRRAADVFPAVSRLADAGIDFGQFLTGFADILRAQLAIELGGTAGDVSEHARRALESRKGKLAAGDLLRMLSALTELEPRFRKSGQQQLLLETMLVRFALLDRSVDLEQVLRALGSPGGAPSGGAPSGGGRSGARAPVAEPRESARAAEPRESARATRPVATEVRSSSGTSAAAAPAPVRSAAPAPIRSAAALPELDLNQLTERWDELVERMRQGGKTLLATALAHSVPQAVTARGDVVVRLEEANDFFAQAIESNRLELLGILREWFTGVERLQLVRDESGAAAPKRMTDEMIRAERLGALRKRDPVLGAAIDALDLDVLD